MSSTRSIIAPPPFAANALTVIPPTPVAGVSYRDPSAGPASSPNGWPYAQRVNSAEFNQIQYQATSLLSILDKKGILGWSDQVNYTESSICFGSDGLVYAWIQASGPAGVGAKDPISNPTFWKKFSSGQLINVRVFKTVGSVAYSPTPGTTSAFAEVHGAGGSGAGTPTTGAGQCAVGGPGGSGAYAYVFFPTGIPAGNLLVVGLGGAPVNGGGTNGGASSIGSLISCPGGKFGTTAGPSAPNLVTGGGSGATGPAAVSAGIPIQATSGNSAGLSFALGLGTTAIGGSPGADGQWGGGGPVVPGNTPGNSASASGAGGSGTATNAGQASIAGGRGGDGCIIIYEYGNP